MDASHSDQSEVIPEFLNPVIEPAGSGRGEKKPKTVFCLLILRDIWYTIGSGGVYSSTNSGKGPVFAVQGPGKH